jgi:hypothetical protein
MLVRRGWPALGHRVVNDGGVNGTGPGPGAPMNEHEPRAGDWNPQDRNL